VDTGVILMTQTKMQNAVDASSLAASQEITHYIYSAGQNQSDATVNANTAAVANARAMAASRTSNSANAHTTQRRTPGRSSGAWSPLTW
jgi:hypothetical protein